MWWEVAQFPGWLCCHLPPAAFCSAIWQAGSSLTVPATVLLLQPLDLAARQPSLNFKSSSLFFMTMGLYLFNCHPDGFVP